MDKLEKKIKNKKVLIQARVDKKLSNEIDKLAMIYGKPSSKIMVALIEIGLEKYGRNF